jgi:glycosyltransferase involved in cell wall biosynthesis
VSLEEPVQQGLGRRIYSAAMLALGRVAPGTAYERLYWSYPVYRAARTALTALQPTIVVANDWNAVPAAAHAAAATGAALAVDFHEFGPRQWDHSAAWRTFRGPMADYVVRSYVDRSTPTMTVCPSLARAYEATYGFTPEVVYNAPRLESLPGFRPTDPDRVRIVHHGVAARVRRLETMVEAVAEAGERYSLDLMLVGDDRGYVTDLRDAGMHLAPGRVNVVPPVPPGEIVGRIAEYDIGLFLLPPTTFNYANALPNKFFDFMAAGLAVAVGPTPDMAAIATRHGFGIVSDGFEPEDMATALRALTTSDIDVLRRQARAAAELYNAETECRKLVGTVERAAA